MAADAVVQAMTRMLSDKKFHDSVAKDPAGALKGLTLDAGEVKLLGSVATEGIDHLFTAKKQGPAAKAVCDYVVKNKAGVSAKSQAALNAGAHAKFKGLGLSSYPPVC